MRAPAERPLYWMLSRAVVWPDLAFVRNGRSSRGRYRLVYSDPAAPKPMEFFGRYLDVTPHSCLVWTNEEGGDGGQVTTIMFEETGGRTLLVMHDLYPSKEALDGAIACGSTGGISDTFEQLDEFLLTLASC